MQKTKGFLHKEISPNGDSNSSLFNVVDEQFKENLKETDNSLEENDFYK